MMMNTVQQLFDIALQHHRSGRLPEAEHIYRQVLAQQSDHADALHNLGVIAIATGRSDVAAELLQRAIGVRPHWPAAISNLGNALTSMGQFDGAIVAYRRAIKLDPQFPEAYNNLGSALQRKGLFDEAMEAFRRSIRLKPQFANPHCNIASILLAKGQFQEAMSVYRQAIAIEPRDPRPYVHLGDSLREAGLLDDSIAAYRQAVALNPNIPDAYNNLGIVLRDRGYVAESIAAYQQAIRLMPAFAQAYSNLGQVLKDEGLLDQAIAAYRESMRRSPGYIGAHDNLILALHYHGGFDARAIAEEHRRWSDLHAARIMSTIQPHDNDRSPDRRLRIGYVSPDFRDHVVGQNLLPLFSHHDHQRFEIFCYSQVTRPDAVTQKLQQCADAWRNIVGVSDDNVALQIRTDRIDILVDLALHTGNNRLLVFARKPAPIQVSYLGYCGSAGLRTIDYHLSDGHLDPPDVNQPDDVGKPLRLARTYWCYQPPDSAEVSPVPEITNGLVNFGCLNNFAKVSRAAMDLWTSILLAVSHSRMIIHASPGPACEGVIRLMREAGVAPDRLLFVGKQFKSDYLRTYSRIDIALDPFPFGGGITTCDALWMGVPVVTLSGGTSVGRGGRSILWAVGLPELIAFSADQYVQIAVDLAKDVPHRTVLRREMRGRMLASPLMDAPGFARDVESAYRHIWRTWCEKE